MESVTLQAGPIPLVKQLATALADSGVEYCHWKSNTQLEAVELGETDLDLLISRRHVRDFNRVLSQCGFVAAERDIDEHFPGMTHFFGYDSSVDRFVHVHAHYQLVLGHDRTKNYRLPIESVYVASASTSRTLPTPAPEFEYAVFVIRMALKYLLWDEVLWNGIRGRWPRMKTSEADELKQLSAAIDREIVTDIVNAHLSFVGKDLFDAAEDAVGGSTPRWRTLTVGHRVEKALRAHARTAPWLDAPLRLWRRVGVALRRRRGSSSRFRLATGGAIIAIMGGDGAGKSTALDRIVKWLGGDFEVYRTHLGKPGWSWTTYTVRGALKVAHNLGILRSRRTAPVPGSGTDEGESDSRRLVWLACIARDRHRVYKKAQRAASRGSVVISDRYPHPALQLMDVPQIKRLSNGGDGSWLLRSLIRLEERYHRLIAPPDLAIVLKVDPEEAARRKTDESRDYVIQRSTEIWDIDWDRHDVRVVDANQPPDVVTAQLKRVIWSELA